MCWGWSDPLGTHSFCCHASFDVEGSKRRVPEQLRKALVAALIIESAGVVSCRCHRDSQYPGAQGRACSCDPGIPRKHRIGELNGCFLG